MKRKGKFKTTKRQRKILFLIAIGIFISGVIIGSFKQFKKLPPPKPTVKTYKDKKCDDKLYYDDGKQKIYFRCVNFVEINTTDKSYELKDYIKEKNLDSFIKLLHEYVSYEGGATKVYHEQNRNMTNPDGITLVKCNKLQTNGTTNTNIYIGPKDLYANENFCIDYTQDLVGRKLIMTYKILNIENSNDEKYSWITLRQYQKEEVSSVKILKSLVEKYNINDNIEITFRISSDSIEIGDTLSIFKNAEPISIKKTDKEGFEQINDLIQ